MLKYKAAGETMEVTENEIEMSPWGLQASGNRNMQMGV